MSNIIRTANINLKNISYCLKEIKNMHKRIIKYYEDNALYKTDSAYQYVRSFFGIVELYKNTFYMHINLVDYGVTKYIHGGSSTSTTKKTLKKNIETLDKIINIINNIIDGKQNVNIRKSIYFKEFIDLHKEFFDGIEYLKNHLKSKMKKGDLLYIPPNHPPYLKNLFLNKIGHPVVPINRMVPNTYFRVQENPRQSIFPSNQRTVYVPPDTIKESDDKSIALGSIALGSIAPDSIEHELVKKNESKLKGILRPSATGTKSGECVKKAINDINKAIDSAGCISDGDIHNKFVIDLKESLEKQIEESIKKYNENPGQSEGGKQLKSKRNPRKLSKKSPAIVRTSAKQTKSTKSTKQTKPAKLTKPTKPAKPTKSKKATSGKSTKSTKSTKSKKTIKKIQKK